MTKQEAYMKIKTGNYSEDLPSNATHNIDLHFKLVFQEPAVPASLEN